MKQFKPMLSAAYEPGSPLDFPRIVSPKLDGIRCVIRDGQALSRALKPIANAELRELLSNPLLNGLDGELISGSPQSDTAFNATTRSVMSQQGEAEGVKFHIFDDMSDPNLPFKDRLSRATERVAKLMDQFPLVLVPHALVFSMEDLLAKYEQFLHVGFEGLMIRDPLEPYKYGRSTAREGGLLKMKPWVDSEAMVLGVQELERNHNEAKLRSEEHTSELQSH